VKRLLALATVIGLAMTGAAISGVPAQATTPSDHATQNGMIAFHKYVPETGHAQIFTMNPDGSHLRELTFTADADNLHPTWSSDGSTIVFERDLPTVAEVFVMNADGTGAHAVTHGCCGGNPAYSPDDKSIAFENYDPTLSISGLAIIDASGTHLRQITTEPVPGPGDTKPHWSPDGRQLVYAEVPSEPNSAVFVINTDGTGRRQLTPWVMDATAPSWSPDGTKILFNVYCCGFSGIVANIFTIRPDGSDLNQLTLNHSAKSGSFDASWSPDGRMIAFAHFPGAPNDRGGADIYTMNADGTDVVNITNSPTNSNNANWEAAPWWGTHPAVD
jgi:WD40-like Beta Propeller Repeat